MKLSRIAVAALAAVSLSVAAHAETKLKLGFVLPNESVHGAALKTFADEVAKRTSGRYGIELYGAGALGNDRQMVEGVQLGTIDLALISPGFVGDLVPEVSVFDVPFLFRDRAHAWAVLDGPIGKDILSKFAAKDMIALDWGENGFRHMTNNKHPITGPADVNGLKIRTMQNDLHLVAFKALGATPLPMPWPEVFPALRQGSIDGEENPIPVVTASKLQEVQKYLSLTGHVYSPMVLIMAPSVYSGLTPEDQKAFAEAAKVTKGVMRAKVKEAEEKGLETLKAAGMQIVTDVDKAKFQEALKPAYAEYGKRFGEGTIERIRAVQATSGS